MYTTDSPLTGFRPLDTFEWDDVLDKHGAVLGGATIVMSYARWCRQYGINPDLALAQACLESAFFTSDRWVNEHNPAGLGITANDTPPNPFASPDEGIRAHVEHLCCYVYTAATCPVDHAHLADRRHLFHDGLPRVADLIRPDRKWAVPGTTYAAHIVQIANDVTGGTVTVPYDRIHTSADFGPDRAISDIQWFVVHDTEGSFPGDESVLTDAAAPVESATFLIGREPGQCVYVVPLTKTPWSCANQGVDTRGISVELSRNPVKGEGGYTDYQYEKLAEVFNWCVAQGAPIPAAYLGRDNMSDFGPLPDHNGIIGHQDVPDPNNGHLYGGQDHHTDPGPNFDWGRFVATIKGGPAPVPPADDFLHLNGFVVGGGFRAFYEATPLSAQTFGLPLSNETQATVTEADGTSHQRTVQFFERAIFIYQPENPPEWQVVCAREDQLVEELS